MLTLPVLGALALAVLWGNTLLVGWATVLEIRRAPLPGPRLAAIVLGIAGILAAAAGCTALALRAPVFGPVSTVGGAACLAYFLLVQPAGTALRDFARAPRR